MVTITRTFIELFICSNCKREIFSVPHTSNSKFVGLYKPIEVIKMVKKCPYCGRKLEYTRTEITGKHKLLELKHIIQDTKTDTRSCKRGCKEERPQNAKRLYTKSVDGVP